MLVLPVLVSCGQAGDSGSSSSSPMKDILGSVTSQTGSQADMQGWVVILQDKNSNISRVAEVDAAGIFKLKSVPTNGTYTIAMTSPSYVMASVLSYPSTTPNTIRQYFKINSSIIPRLIYKGPIVTVENEQGITMQKDLATDEDADGIPDGSVSLSLTGRSFESLVDLDTDAFNLLPNNSVTDEGAFLLASGADIDIDGIPNVLDPDIDGDGISNIFDPDDDGDAILDVFDADSDGDLVADATEETTDVYFPEGLKWINVKFDMTPKDDGTYKTTLTFMTELRNEGRMPTTVQIRGAPSLLNAANVETIDADGNAATQAWDRRLFDDGMSEDGSAGDLKFGRKVVLDSGKVPTYHQVVFFQLVYGSGESAWAKEYAYTFPPLTPKAITPKYDSITGTISLSGNPFGDIQDFVWAAAVFSSDGQMVYSTPAIVGTSRSYKIPANVLEDGSTYTYKVTAQVLDRVPGYASYTIHSKVLDLE